MRRDLGQELAEAVSRIDAGAVAPHDDGQLLGAEFCEIRRVVRHLLRQALFLRHDGLVRTRAERHIGLEVRLNAERQRFPAPVKRWRRRRLLRDGVADRTQDQGAADRDR